MRRFVRWLWTAWLPLRVMAVDPTALLLLVLAPLTLVAVLGLSLGPLFSGKTTPPVPERVVLLVPAGESRVAQTFQRALEQAGSALPRVERRQVGAAARDQAVDELRRGLVDAVVELPPTGSGKPIDVLADPTRVGTQVVQGVIREAARAVAAAAGGPGAMVSPATASTPGAEAQSSGQAAEEGRIPTLPALDYYAIGMGVFFLLFAANSAASEWLTERKKGIYARIRSAGVGRSSYFLARFAGAVLVGFVFLVVQAAGTRLLFGVHWGDPLAWAALSVAGAAMAAGLATLIMALSRDAASMGQVGSALFNVISFLGGSMMPAYVFPAWLDRISRWLPTRWLLDAYGRLHGGAGIGAVWPEAGWLLTAALGLLAVAVLVDRASARRAGEV
ncbi:MAG: ABC transporter permease [Firmicutes bacterium]|nr:ABC transporter permease [Bacillota bacterium]